MYKRPDRKTLSKVEDKKLKEKELIERKKRQEKPSKIFDVIEEVIKTPYYIRGGDRSNKAKGGIASGMRRFNRGGKV